MSVRRLAKEQPASLRLHAGDAWRRRNWWIAKFPAGRQQSAVIPILWLVQKQEGWVSEPAIRAVAELLGMPVIRVLEVATFYTMFQLEPVGDRGPDPGLRHHALHAARRRRPDGGLQGQDRAEGPPVAPTASSPGRRSSAWAPACNAPMAADQRLLLRGPDAGDPGADHRRLRAGKTPKPGSYAGRQTSEPPAAR